MSWRRVNTDNEGWELPTGFSWEFCRIVHELPELSVNGWRVTLRCQGAASVEVIHRDAEHAREIAIAAACEIWPNNFKKGPRT